MEIIDKILDLAKQYSARFLSLGFVDITGKLQQRNVIITSLNITKDIALIEDKKLKLIEDKFFFDPFRSHPTIFCFCQDLSSEFDYRSNAKYSIDSALINHIPCEGKLNFLLHCQNKNLLPAYEYVESEPLDKLVNLRSEIMDILDNIGIKTTYHYNGSDLCQCLIGMKANNLLDMADNIILAKYIIKNVAQSYGKYVTFTRNGEVPISIYLDLSSSNKEEAQSAVRAICKNTAIGDYAEIKIDEDYNIIKLLIKNAEVNPYILLINS
jgi:glutamine synthetase